MKIPIFPGRSKNGQENLVQNPFGRERLKLKK